LSGPEVTNGDGDDNDRVRPPSVLADLPCRIERPEGGPLKIASQRAVALPLLPSLDRACLAARVAADNKAKDVVVLDLRGITPLYDFFVIASGVSRRQVHTISEEIDAALHEQGDERLAIEGYQASKWVVQDYGDVMVHIFDPIARDYYALEDLWADAPRVDWERN
jgi:ribosome-associated protein